MAVTFQIHTNLNGWSPLTYAVGNRITSGASAYQCTVAGSSTSAPTGTGSAINNGGTAVFKWLSAADFTTIAAAIAALPSTFTQPITWAFWNNGTILTTGTSPFATLTGHTTTSTNNLTWTCAPGESIRDALHGGHTALAFNAAAGVSFTLPATNPGFHVDYFDIFDANVVFDGLQFLNPNGTNGCSILAVEPAGTGFTARNCIFDYTAQAGMTQLGFYAPSYTVGNSLFVDRQPVAGGQIGVKAEDIGTFVNCTAVAPNAPAGAVFIVSDVATLGSDPWGASFASDYGPTGGVVVRNTACFGFTAGIANSVAIGGAVVIDHSATDASTLGNANGDAGGNLVGQSAATTFVSLGTNARPVLGATILDAGVPDTGDIPTTDDIARNTRPQGAAWDIGALEFLPVRLRGSSMAGGRARLGSGMSARAGGQARGRAVLTVPATTQPTGRGGGRTFGAANPTYIQTALVVDPWSADFSIDFGPLVNAQAAIHGQSMAAGRASPVGSVALSATGVARSKARTTATGVVGIICRGNSMAAGRAAGQYVQGSLIVDPWSVDFSTDFGPLPPASGFVGASISKSSGLSNGKYSETLAGVSQSRSGGKSVIGLRALASCRGSAAAHGNATPPPAVAILRAVGGASSLAGAVGLYSTSTNANRGRAASWAKATLAPSVALQASGASDATGNLLYANNALILNVRGAGQSSATAVTMGLAAAPAAAGASGTFARSQINIAQSISAAGTARVRAVTGLLFSGLLPSRGQAIAKGHLTTVATTATPSGRGIAISKARSLTKLITALVARAPGAAAARAMIVGTLPMLARGSGQASGQIGANTQRHLQAGGKGATQATTAITSKNALSGQGSSTSHATATSLFSLLLSAVSNGRTNASGSLNTLGQILGRGQGRSSGTIVASQQTALSAGAMAMATAAASAVRFVAALYAPGLSVLTGRASASLTVGLMAHATSISSGQAAGFGFAPIALVGTGRAGALAAATPTARLVLAGTSVGLSAGRCASIQSVTLLATGRSHGFGYLQAASAVGITAHGTAKATGRLFSRHLIVGSGQATSQSQSRLSGAFNVTPDVSGPRLSTIGSLPAFDAMDLSDVDFFSFDWSGRASALGDPIVSAAVTASPSGMAIGQVVVSGSIVQVRVTAGSLEETFSLRCSVTLRSGRILHWSAPVPVADF